MLGTSPTQIPLAFEHTVYPSVDKKLASLLKIRQEAIAAHTFARNRMINFSKNPFTPFKKGDLVWLDSRNLKLGHNKKISTKREGPFPITEVLGPVTYRLKLPNYWKIHDVFHATLLSEYSETPEHGPNFPQPPPDIIGGEEEYELDRIHKHRGKQNNREYFVSWKGFTPFHNSWEPESHLANAPDILLPYKKRHKLT